MVAPESLLVILVKLTDQWPQPSLGGWGSTIPKGEGDGAHWERVHRRRWVGDSGPASDGNADVAPVAACPAGPLAQPAHRGMALGGHPMTVPGPIGWHGCVYTWKPQHGMHRPSGGIPLAPELTPANAVGNARASLHPRIAARTSLSDGQSTRPRHSYEERVCPVGLYPSAHPRWPGPSLPLHPPRRGGALSRAQGPLAGQRELQRAVPAEA